MQNPFKTLKNKPKKTIITTARVLGVEPAKVSKSGNFMVTTFNLAFNGPAASEAPQNGAKAYFTWAPSWFQPGFDIVQLSLFIDKLDQQIQAGDEEAAAQKRLYNSNYLVAVNNIFGDEDKEVPTLKGLVGGRNREEHDGLWNSLCSALAELGAANPGVEDDEDASKAAQDAIITGVDELFARFFAPESPAGKFLALTYGHKGEKVLDENGQHKIDPETGKKMYDKSQYRNILKWIIPGAKTDMIKKLASWRTSCAKENSQTVYVIDDSEPFGSVPF